VLWHFVASTPCPKSDTNRQLQLNLSELSILSHFNYHPIGTNVANFDKIWSTVSEI